MILSFPSSIASAFLKVLQFFGMTDTTTSPPFEKPDPRGTDIERYISNLKNGYNANGDATGGAANRMQYYRVKELYHCKEISEVGHEYISTMVVKSDDNSQPEFYIVFERFRGPDDLGKPNESSAETKNEKHPPRPDSFKKIVQAGSKSSSPCLRDGPANDRVSTSDGRERQKGELKRIVTFKHSIPLYKIAVLANTVHFSEKTYDINSSNCYFYATTVVQVMEQVYSEEVEESKILNTTSTMRGQVPLFHRTPFKSFIQKKIDPDTILKISNRYKINLGTFETEVCSSRVHRNRTYLH